MSGERTCQVEETACAKGLGGEIHSFCLRNGRGWWHDRGRKSGPRSDQVGPFRLPPKA